MGLPINLCVKVSKAIETLLLWTLWFHHLSHLTLGLNVGTCIKYTDRNISTSVEQCIYTVIYSFIADPVVSSGEDTRKQTGSSQFDAILSESSNITESHFSYQYIALSKRGEMGSSTSTAAGRSKLSLFLAWDAGVLETKFFHISITQKTLQSQSMHFKRWH